jgi:KDO2-lipid IV(A) lauroyltransferase
MEKTFLYYFARIPHKHLHLLAGLLGKIVYAVDYRHRRIIKSNLKFAYPDWPVSKVKETTLRIYHNTCITLFELLQLSRMSAQAVLEMVSVRGEENLKNALTKTENRGIIFISAHIGNWEISPSFTALYFNQSIVSIARKVSPKWVDQWISRVRTRFGNRILDKKGALTTMARTLRSGNILGILIDQGTKRSEGVEVRFFGRTTTATPAAAMLARRYDSIVIPAYCTRGPNKQLTLTFESPLELVKTDDSQADIRVNTQTMTDAIEKAVREFPDQWFWFHKRWKRHYPGLYREDIKRHKLRKKRKIRNTCRVGQPD